MAKEILQRCRKAKWDNIKGAVRDIDVNKNKEKAVRDNHSRNNE